MNAQHWNDVYRSREQLFSGEPNGVLVAEAESLPPGRALDVGCGEGADALWLAHHGWQVTALDISEVALGRAAAADTLGRVNWTQADLTVAPPPVGAFDLVSVQYFPVRRRADHAGLQGLLSAVAPGGTLLFGTHDFADLVARPDFDPGEYYQPDDVARVLGPGWRILVNEFRPRTTAAPEGTGHTRDGVLRAQRLA